MKVYFDWNIFIELLVGHLPDLEKAIFQNKTIEVPFSSAHIQEAINITPFNATEIARRFNYITKVTKNIYLYAQESYFSFQQDQSPYTVYATISEIPFGKTAFNLLTNLISYNDRKISRKDMGIDPAILNNYEQDPFSYINSILSKYPSPNTSEHLSIEHYFDASVSILNKHNLAKTDENKVNSMMKVIILFSYLDSFGFWPDKEDSYKKGSHYWDGIHCYHGIYNDYFITNDKRLSKKAKAVYNHLDVKTQVLYLKENLETIIQLFES